MFDFSKEKIVAGFEESLQRLGLDYVDVLQVGARRESFTFSLI